MGMTDRHQAQSYPLRMPADLKEKVTVAAKESGRSVHAEIVNRIQSSFERAVSDGKPLLDLLEAQKKTISTQDTAIVTLQSYLVEIINSLPLKMQRNDRVMVATKFALGIGHLSDSQPVQALLPLGRTDTGQTIQARVRGKSVDTGIPVPFTKSNKGALLVGSLGRATDAPINTISQKAENGRRKK